MREIKRNVWRYSTNGVKREKFEDSTNGVKREKFEYSTNGVKREKFEDSTNGVKREKFEDSTNGVKREKFEDSTNGVKREKLYNGVKREKFEDSTNGVIISRKSIERQCNDQKRKEKKDKQWCRKHYTENKNWATRTPVISGELRYTGRVSSSYFTCVSYYHWFFSKKK